MIEITAKLVREQTPVFLCGEIVECFLYFTNPPLPEHKIAQSNNDILENLAWATAQIHCYRSSSSNNGNSMGSNNNNNSGSNINATSDKSNEILHIYSAETALNPTNQSHGDVVIVTEPKILFCDLRLTPGETKAYLFKETLPLTSPPTYRGTAIRYFYKITITTQRVGSKIQMLRVPIRVLPLPTIMNPEEISVLCNETNEELAPTNPFLEKRKSESKLELALHHLQNITARRRPNFYLISNKRGKVARFCLFKPAYKLGEDIVGTLDFSIRQNVRCIQVSVTLQCEEILLKQSNADEKQQQQQQQPHQLTQQQTEGKIMNFTKHHEMCMGLLQTQMILPIPLHVTPTFKTSHVEVKWRLHFEFVTSTCDDFGIQNDNVWLAPTDIPIETMVWNLPVTLYPTAPMQILQQSGKHLLIIK